MLISNSHAQLFADILDDPLIGRGCGGQDGHRLGKPSQQVLDPAIIRTEIMSPVRNAVGLVHDQKAELIHQLRELLVPEPGVIQSLGRDQ